MRRSVRTAHPQPARLNIGSTRMSFLYSKIKNLRQRARTEKIAWRCDFFQRASSSEAQPSGRPKRYLYPPLLSLVWVFLFSLSCSSSTSQIKSKPSLKSKSYEKLAMRELREELAQRRKEGFPNLLKGPSGTYVYDTKKQKYVLRKKLSPPELRALASKKLSSSPHHVKSKSKSYRKTAMRELRDDLIERRKEGFPNLVEAPSGPHTWNTKKQEYLLDQRLLERRRAKGLSYGLNKNKYILRGSLKRGPRLASKKPSPPASIEAPQARASAPVSPKPPQARASTPVSPKPPQAARPAPVPTKPSQAARPAPVPTKPSQTARSAPVSPKPSQAARSAPVSPKPSQAARSAPVSPKPSQAARSAPRSQSLRKQWPLLLLCPKQLRRKQLRRKQLRRKQLRRKPKQSPLQEKRGEVGALAQKGLRGMGKCTGS